MTLSPTQAESHTRSQRGLMDEPAEDAGSSLGGEVDFLRRVPW